VERSTRTLVLVVPSDVVAQRHEPILAPALSNG
jgi:hypothetical protein